MFWFEIAPATFLLDQVHRAAVVSTSRLFHYLRYHIAREQPRVYFQAGEALGKVLITISAIATLGTTCRGADICTMLLLTTVQENTQLTGSWKKGSRVSRA